MARVLPFRPLRYSPAAGPLEDLLTQPYDKITPEMRARYLSRSEYNLVRVILGERQMGDNDLFNPYTRAAAYFRKWVEERILTEEPQAGFFPYSQQFQHPETGQTLIRSGFIGLGEVLPYSAQVVHRHEQTLTGPKKDRMQVLTHTGAHFGQIFMIYPDAEGRVDQLLASAMAEAPLCSVTDEYGTVHRMWRMNDPAQTAAVSEAMADKKLIIADGHHRYETAQMNREAHPELDSARFVMMTFINMYSPGLTILPTHRVVHSLENFDPGRFFASLPASMRVEADVDAGRITSWMAEAPDGTARFGCAAAEGVRGIEAQRQPGELDLTILHGRLLEATLGIDAEALREERHVHYIRGAGNAIAQVLSGAAQLAFLVNPATVEEVSRVSLGGGVMPQKSTDFYPKLLTGLAIYRL